MRSLPLLPSLGFLLVLACGGGAEEAPELPDRGVQVRLEEGEAEEAEAEEAVVEEAAVEEATVEEAAVEEATVEEAAVEPGVAEVAAEVAAAEAAPAPVPAKSRGPRRRPAKAEAETAAAPSATIAPAADAAEPEPAGAVDQDAAEALLGEADGAAGLGLTGTGQGGGGSGTAPGIGAVVGRGAGPAVASRGAEAAAGGDDAFDWLESLPDSAIQYNRPEEVPFDGSFQVGLVIDISGDHEAAGGALYELRTDHPEMVGRTMAVDAPTGDEVEVTLLGSNARIEPLEPERQRVSKRKPAQWRWRITPEAPQDIELNLSVMAIEPGRQNGLKIESYSDTIHVRVTAPQRAKLWLADNWEWAWTFLGAPIFAFGWSRVQRRRREAEGASAAAEEEPAEG